MTEANKKSVRESTDKQGNKFTSKASSMNSNKWDESHCPLNQLHSLFQQRQAIGQCELNCQVARPITHRTVSKLSIEKK